MIDLKILVFYITSLLPLWISIIFINLKSIIFSKKNINTEILSLPIISLALFLSIFAILYYIKYGDKSSKMRYTIIEAKKEKILTLEYLFSNILPMVAFNFTLWDGNVLFLIYFIFNLFLVLKNKYLAPNIFLELFNYSFYECKLEDENEQEFNIKIISKKNLTIMCGEKIIVQTINNDYKIEMNN